MTLGLTKPGKSVLAPLDAGGQKRNPVLREMQTWSMEIERVVEAAIETGLNFQGGWDASAGTFPGAGASIKGQSWRVTTGGTVDSVVFAVGDLIVALVDNASTTTYATKWIKVAPIQGDDGAGGASINPSGAWTIGTTYAERDFVSFGTRTFVSIADGNIGHEPPSADEDDAYWMWVPSVVGATGPQGEQGVQGEQGIQGIQGEQGPAGADGAGAGDVVGPASAVDQRIAVFDGVTGKLIEDSGATIAELKKGEVQVAVSDETTAVTTGAAKITFRMPFALTLNAGNEGVRASLSTAQTSGSVVTVDINEAGASILSTKLTIDNGEKTSVTAATPPVISDTILADDAEITIDIDQVGDGTAAGLKVTLRGVRA